MKYTEGHIKEVLELWNKYLGVATSLKEEERQLFIETMKVLIYPRVEITSNGNFDFSDGLLTPTIKSQTKGDKE